MAIELTLTGMSPSGEAVGRHDGLVVFVRYGLPGERVEAEITARRRSYARGRATRVLQPHSDRIQPRCPYFGACGGCDWQHARYPAQVDFKTGIVREQLARLGGFADPPVQPCSASPVEYGYRNHTQFGLSPDGRPGYYRSASRTIVTVAQCPILHQALQPLLDALNSGVTSRGEIAGLRALHLRCGAHAGQRMLVFEMNALDPRPVLEWVKRAHLPPDVGIALSDSLGSAVLSGAPSLTERVGEHTYAVSPGAFFQVHAAVAAGLASEVLGMLDLRGGESVLDLYCGAGLFTLPIAERAGRVIGVESGLEAARDAQANLSRAKNAEIMAATVEDALASEPIRSGQWDALVADPPRAGLGRSALDRLAGLRASRLVLVSCEPTTLARDARRLREKGYRLVRAQPFDMFPQTRHVETAALFEPM